MSNKWDEENVIQNMIKKSKKELSRLDVILDDTREKINSMDKILQQRENSIEQAQQTYDDLVAKTKELTKENLSKSAEIKKRGLLAERKLNEATEKIKQLEEKEVAISKKEMRIKSEYKDIDRKKAITKNFIKELCK